MTGHPTAESLADYAFGGLDDAATEELREHLAGCVACTRIVLDLQGAADTTENEAEPGADPVLDDAWRRFEAARVGEPPRRVRLSLAAIVPWLVVALVATSLGVVVQQRVALERAEERVEELETQLGMVTGPQTDVQSVTLLPRGALRTGQSVAIVERPSHDASFVALALAGVVEGDGDEDATRKIELLDDADTLLWRGAGTPDDRAQIHLLLPASLLPHAGGRLTLRVHAAGAAPTASATYELWVRTPAEAVRSPGREGQ